MAQCARVFCRYYLKACPIGHRLVDAMEKGYEGQDCVECNDGEFILDSTSSAFQCQKCPPTANGCRNKGPPVFSRLVRGVVAAHSASGDAAEALPDGLPRSMATMLAAKLELDASMVTFAAVCNSTDAACSSPLLRRADTGTDRASASRFWVLSFSVYLPREGVSELNSSALEALVSESAHHAFAAEDVDVVVDARLDQGSETDALDGWKFVLSPAGEVQPP